MSLHLNHGGRLSQPLHIDDNSPPRVQEPIPDYSKYLYQQSANRQKLIQKCSILSSCPDEQMVAGFDECPGESKPIRNILQIEKLERPSLVKERSNPLV